MAKSKYYSISDLFIPKVRSFFSGGYYSSPSDVEQFKIIIAFLFALYAFFKLVPDVLITNFIVQAYYVFTSDLDLTQHISKENMTKVFAYMRALEITYMYYIPLGLIYILTIWTGIYIKILINSLKFIYNLFSE